MKTTLRRLKGKGAGYCCRIYIEGAHVATVAHPTRHGVDGAREAAYAWDQTYRKKLGF